MNKAMIDGLVDKLKITELVDKLAEWEKLAKDAKVEITKIESELQRRAVAELENKKFKQVKFYGSNGNVAVITNAETVKMVSYEFLKNILGENIIKDFVKEKPVSYDLTDHFKKIVAPIILKNYIEATLDSAISQLGLDEKKAKLARKKLKGNYEKDIDFFKSIGFESNVAEENAFLVKEAIAYEKLVYLLDVAGYAEGTKKFYTAIENLRHAVIVEETLKIGVDYEEDGSK